MSILPKWLFYKHKYHDYVLLGHILKLRWDTFYTFKIEACGGDEDYREAWLDFKVLPKVAFSIRIPKIGKYEWHANVYGISWHENFVSIKYGKQTHDSSTEQNKGFFLPWLTKRFCGLRYYDLNKKLLIEMVEQQGKHIDWKIREAIEQAVPKIVFKFTDYDGEEIEATCHIEERWWKHGESWCKWLSIFVKDTVQTTLSMSFDKEVGQRKGSWKGGITGTGAKIELGETPFFAFKRYADKHSLTDISVVTFPKETDKNISNTGSVAAKLEIKTFNN